MRRISALSLVFALAVFVVHSRPPQVVPPAKIHSVFTQAGPNEYHLIAFVQTMLDISIDHQPFAGPKLPGLTEASRSRPTVKAAKVLAAYAGLANAPPCRQGQVAVAVTDNQTHRLAPAGYGRIATGPPARV